MKPKFVVRRHLFNAFIALAFGSAATSVSAQSNWVGNSSVNLSDAANWSALPTSGTAWAFGAAGSSGNALVNDLTTSTAFEVAGINFAAAATAYVIDSAHTGTFSLTGNIVSAATGFDQTLGSNIAISGTRQVNLNGSKNIILTGNLSGNGSLTQTAGGTGAKSISFNGDNSSFSGSFIQNNDSNNRTAFGSPSGGSANAAWTFNRTVNGGVALNNINGNTIHFGSLSGAAYMRANTTGTTTVSVGALNTSTTFTGLIQDNGNSNIAFTKVGTGTLTLTGVHTYDGATTVSGGTLDITTGTISNSAVTVNSGATFQIAGSGKTIAGLTVGAGATAKVGAISTITNAMSVSGSTGSPGTVDLVNGSIGTVAVNGAGGLTLGGATATDTASLKFEVGGTADKLQVLNALAVDAGGASIQITNLGLASGQSYPLITFSSGSGAGFATGTGTTVGALTLATPNLSFGVSGSLEVTATGVNLVTTGAAAPAEAYWSGTNGANWSDTSGSNANFTTTAGGGTFLNVLPASNTMVYFSNSSPSNLSNSLGANFNISGITYRGGSAAVQTTGTQTLIVESGGITVESGNGGASLGMSSLILGSAQTWQNDSSNPLSITAASVTGPSATLTLAGSGAVHLGGGAFSVNALQLNAGSSLDLKGTPVTAAIGEGSNGNITNTAAVAGVTSLTFNNTSSATYSGVISDSGSGSAQIQLVKSGTGEVTLGNANTHTGGTSIANGILKAGHNSALGAGNVSLTGVTAVLDLNGATIGNPLINSATGAVITNTSTNEAIITSGFNYTDAASVVISDFTVNGTGDIRWDGAIRRTAGTGTVTKSGPNTLIITEANDPGALFGGMNLRIDNGTVLLGQTTTSFQDLTINGGTLKMDPNYEVTVAAIWSGVFGNTAVMNGGVWDLNDTGTGANVTNRIKRITGTGGTITNTGTGPSQLILAARDVATPSWAGNIEDGTNGGTVSLTITNGGSVNQVMTFSGVHTYSGATNIARNTMRAGAANVFSANSEYILSNNTESTLDLDGFNNTIGALSGVNAASKVVLGAGTLTVGGLGYSGSFNGIISGTGGVVKVGSGSLALTGVNTYTGDTVVDAGSLAVDGDSIEDSGKLVVNSGVVDVTGTETVGSLYFGATQQAAGTWGATGSGATHIDDDRFSGTGVVSVTNGPSGGYAAWALSKGLTPGVNDGATQDPENDRLENALEFVLGGDPLASDTSILPVATVTATDFVFTFNRADDSEAEITLVFEHGNNLTAWIPVTVGVDNASSGAEVAITENGASPDSIVVTIPKGSNTTLFGRLKGTKN